MLGRKLPPLDCKQVKDTLRWLGLEPRPQNGTSHEQWVGYVNGKFTKVTVDCPKAPFGPDLIKSMAAQCGLRKSKFHQYCVTKRNKRGKVPEGYPAYKSA